MTATLVLAFTATAGAEMQGRILQSLGVPDARVFLADVDRPNIALVRARWNELTAFFTVATARQPDDSWRVTLTPKSGSFAALLGKVVVTGCKGVSEVTISRANGDHESIRFRDDASAAP